MSPGNLTLNEAVAHLVAGDTPNAKHRCATTSNGLTGTQRNLQMKLAFNDW